MYTHARTLLAIIGLALICPARAHAAKAEHAPVTAACGDIWYDVDYEPASIESLKDLTPEARSKLSAWLDDYLGHDFASKLKLTGGQLLDRKELLEKVPASTGFNWKPPKYNLFMEYPVAGTIHGFCASIQLDDDGTVMSPLTLPKLSEHPDRGKIASAREAARVAESNGVPVGKATRELLYFPDSDTVEYDFAYVSREEGADVEYTHLHVLANDVSQIHWSKSIETR